MRRLTTPCLLALMMLALGGCRHFAPAGDTLYQVSTIDALLAGAYEGVETSASLLGRGDFGIGTFDRLDGEMLVIDGVVYQVCINGDVHEVPGGATTPFATVSHFEPEGALELDPGQTFEALPGWLDARLGNPNLPLAIRIEGRFRTMKTRSVPAQRRPFAPLAEVVAHQAVFTMQDVEGTIVGYRTPAYFAGLNVPGYHLHFLSADRSRGGHILAFKVDRGRLSHDFLHNVQVRLPEGEGEFARADLVRDRTDELHRVEK